MKQGIGKRLNLKIQIILVTIIICFGVIFFKALSLKTSSRALFETIENKRIIAEHSFRAPSGDIYSFDNTTGELLLLATNQRCYDIYMDLGQGVISAKGSKRQTGWIIDEKKWKTQLDSLSIKLANLFPERNKNQWKQYLQTNRNKKNRGTLIAKMASEDKYKELKSYKLVRHAIFGELKYKRIYPYGDMARRTIGIEYIDNGESKRNGIDGYYAERLQGSVGKRLERKIAPGLWIPINDTMSIRPKNGDDIITTIDVPLQELAQNALRKCLDSNDARQGTVILMETKTGYVKALASYTRKDEHEYYEDLNVAVGSTFEPGSTYKIVTAMMLLDKGLCDTAIMVPTGMKEFQGASKPIYDVNKKGPDKQVSLARSLEISSNVAISSLVYDLFGQDIHSRQQFARELQEYFPYKKLECDIKVHEPQPKIGSSKYVDDMLRMSFGYVTSITPLQLLAFYNGIANNGVMLKPKFVKSVMRDKKIIQNFAPDTIKRQMCKPATLSQIQNILKGVVKHGTGRRLSSASYGIAGKSGTAEVNYTGTVKSRDRLHRASFVGYFPADNPQYSCIVIICEPKGGVTHGGDLAAPVFREISDRVMGVNAQKTELTKANKPKQTEVVDVALAKDQRKMQISKALDTKTTPNVKGWNIKDAVYVLQKLGYKVKFEGYGKVTSQSIAPKTEVKQGSVIKLTLSHGKDK